MSKNKFMVKIDDREEELLPFINEGKLKLNNLSRTSIELAKKDNILLLIGSTGVGKTTLTNYINDVPLKSMSEDGNAWKITLRDGNQGLPGGFNIGHSTTKSETLFPSIYSPKGKDFSYIDCPGFGDSRGTAIEIANLFFRATVAEGVKNLKFLLIVSSTDLTSSSGRGDNFLKSLKDLANFIGAFNKSENILELQGSIGIVVTQVNNSAALRKTELENEITSTQQLLQHTLVAYEHSPDTVKPILQPVINGYKTDIEKKSRELASYTSVRPMEEVVKEKLQTFIKDKKDDLLGNTGEIILNIVNNDKFRIFSNPQKPVDIDPVEKGKILELIDNLKYISAEHAVINTIIPEAHSGELKDYIQASSNDLINEIKPSIQQVLTSFINQEINKAQVIQDIQNLQEKIEKIIMAGKEDKDLEEFTKFISLVNPEIIIKNKKINDKIIKAIEEDKTIEFFTKLLPSESQQTFQYKKKYSEELQLLELSAKWNHELNVLTKPEEVSIANNELLCNGVFVHFSNISNKLKIDTSIKAGGIKSMKIYAFSSFIINDNCDLEQFRGADVTVVAPKWEVNNSAKTGGNVKSYITFNLSGLDQDSYPDNENKAINGIFPGGNGDNGKQGLPGLNGGNFIGIGKEFYQLNDLKIISNGGKGGNGQNGGHGAQGKKGEDAKLCEVDKIPQYLLNHNPSGVSKDKYYLKEGKIGDQGGNAGAGGIGGYGGIPGKIHISKYIDGTFNCKPLSISIEIKEGFLGANGKSGIPGKGGVYGDSAVKVYYKYEDNLCEILKSAYLVKSFKYAAEGKVVNCLKASENTNISSLNLDEIYCELMTDYNRLYTSFNDQLQELTLVNPFVDNQGLSLNMEVIGNAVLYDSVDHQ